MATYMIQNVDRTITAKDYKHLADNQLLVHGMFYTIQGEGSYAGVPAFFVRLAGCNFGAKDHGTCLWCFPENETLMTPLGKRTFSEVQVGDDLYTLNDSGELVTTTVRKVLKRNVPTQELVRVVYQMPGSKTTKTLVCTKDHPFHTTKRGYVAAGELTSKDEIYHADSYAVVSAFRKTSNPMKDKHVALKVSRKMKQLYRDGDLEPYFRTAENKELQSVAKRGARNPMKRHEVRLKNALSHTYPKSGLEKKFERTFKQLRVKARYTGNTKKLIVGNDKVGYRLPDFELGENKIVEVYDTTFNRYKEGIRNRDSYERPVRNFYKKFGYDCLFLTNEDFPKVGSGNEIQPKDFLPLKEKVGMFLRNGARIVKVASLTASGKEMFAPGGESSVVNFSCHPYNTFLVGGLHTHNCDTAFHYDNGKAMTFDEIYVEYAKATPGVGTLMVITGGEPSLQTNLVELIRFMSERDIPTQIESNGTRVPLLIECLVASSGQCTVVISPKASHKGYGDLRPSITALDQASEGFDYYFKFVVTADEDDKHHTVPDEVLEYAELNPGSLYISPMAVYKKPYVGEVSSAWDHELIDAERTSKNYAYAAKYVMEHPGLVLSIQQHLFCNLA